MRRINIETPLLQNSSPVACIFSLMIVVSMFGFLAFIAYMIGFLI